MTVAKFTSDGKKLLSCSGDKTIKFHSLNGPDITTYKSVQTQGSGCINDLCVEANNKFAVTCGQDKKLNVWNIQSGRIMRSYKSGSNNSELYKCDVDPSGNRRISRNLSPLFISSLRFLRYLHCHLWFQ